MGRERKIKVGGLNIRVHTQHIASEYVDLWTMLHRMRRPKIRGNNATMIGDLRKLNAQPDSPLYGYLYRFVDINPEDPWFDIEEHKKADAEDVAEVNIPAKLKPNLREYPYIFNVAKHRLYFKTGGHGGGVSPGVVHSLIEELVSSARVKKRFNDVDVTTITQKGAIEALLQWPEIRRIDVTLQRPNPSDFDDEKSFYERLNRRGLEKELNSFIKAKGVASITPDAEMKKMFGIAADNGIYRQVGINAQGELKSASSQEYPMQEIENYDPDLQTEREAFQSLVLSKFK